MLDRLFFTMAALAIALTGEILRTIFASNESDHLAVTLFIYMIYLQGFFELNRHIDQWLPLSLLANIFYLTSAGLGGLLILERLFTHSPWGNNIPDQLSMLIFHACYPFVGRIFIDHRPFATPTKQRICVLYLAFLMLAQLGLLLPNSLAYEWFIRLPILFSMILLFPISHYIVNDHMQTDRR